MNERVGRCVYCGGADHPAECGVKLSDLGSDRTQLYCQALGVRMGMPPPEKPDWFIVWYPQILLACCLLPILAFCALAVVR